MATNSVSLLHSVCLASWALDQDRAQSGRAVGRRRRLEWRSLISVLFVCIDVSRARFERPGACEETQSKRAAWGVICMTYNHANFVRFFGLSDGLSDSFPSSLLLRFSSIVLFLHLSGFGSYVFV